MRRETEQKSTTGETRMNEPETEMESRHIRGAGDAGQGESGGSS